MRIAGRVARAVLEYACRMAEPGMTCDDIDRLAHEEAVRLNVFPSPLNYFGFPKSICTSVNEVVCHGIPDSRQLLEGDVLSIDVSVYVNGFHGDNCKTVVVGKGDKEAYRLVQVNELALQEAISICGPGV